MLLRKHLSRCVLNRLFCFVHQNYVMSGAQGSKGPLIRGPDSWPSGGFPLLCVWRRDTTLLSPPSSVLWWQCSPPAGVCIMSVSPGHPEGSGTRAWGGGQELASQVSRLRWQTHQQSASSGKGGDHHLCPNRTRGRRIQSRSVLKLGWDCL